MKDEEAGWDVLAIGAHPDDVELFAGGTLALAAGRGRRVAILDLSAGESATRGTPATRAREAAAAADRLGVGHRECLGLPDSALGATREQLITLTAALRRLRPRLVLTHWLEDRHPDHRHAYELVREAVFFTNVGGYPAAGERWRIEALACFIGNPPRPPARVDWIVDTSAGWDRKLAALEAYASQFRASPGDPRATYIASPEYWEQLGRRDRAWGHMIGASHGEPFVTETPVHAGHPLARLLEPKG